MGKVNSKQIVNFVAKYSIYFITLIFMIICSIVNNRFLTLENLTNILRQVSVYALLAFAESVCIISGNLDLAAASTLIFAGCSSIFVYTSTNSLLLAVIVAILLGMVINLVSGLIVAFLNVPPFVATLGMQMAVVEFARNVLNRKDANSEEFDELTLNPVIHIMNTQKEITKKGGTMRLGAYP